MHAPAPIAWDAPIVIATGAGERGPWRQNDSHYDHVDDPAVVIDADGAAIVAWVDQRARGVLVARFARDGTSQRGEPVDVSRTPDVFSWLPRIALSPAHDEDVYVAWQEIVFSGGTHGGELYVARSVDGGASFEPARNLSRSIAGDGKGRIDADRWHNGSFDIVAGDSGMVFVAWTEYEGRLWLARSADRGASFDRPRLVASDEEHPARAPSLASDGDTVYLAWTTGEEPRADIQLAVSRDGGATFSAPARVAETETYSDAPKLAVASDGTLHVVYAESAGGPFDRFEIHHARSHDGGATFTRPVVVSRPRRHGIESAHFPSLAVDGAVVHVAWETYPVHAEPPRGLAIATSLDGGETFSAPTEVPHSVGPYGGGNGSFQGRLMRKLAARDGELAIVNSSLALGRGSQVWLIRGELAPARAAR